MTLAVFSDLHALVSEGEQKMKDFLEQRAPEIDHAAQAVEAIAGNPLVQAALGAANISPGMTQAFADLLNKLDAEIEGAKRAAVSAAVQPPAEPAPEGEAGPEAVPGE